jgi:uncharacterized repeat protein (TIGR03803 family)
MIRRFAALALIVSATMAAHPASLLYSFTGLGPETPASGVIYDGHGGLFGTTEYGGAFNAGTIFHLVPGLPGASWTLTDLYDFGAPDDGSLPTAGLLRARNGVLYGTTERGGVNGDGTVFEFDPQIGAERVLHSFVGADGAGPEQRLTADARGVLYGTTAGGGSANCRYGGCGVLFEVVPSATQGAASETTLHMFTGKRDGAHPSSQVLLDASGNAYVTTRGPYNGALVSFSASDNWAAHVVHEFSATTDGHNPSGPIAMDASGAIYGSLVFGGAVTFTASGRECRATLGKTGCGAVYRLSPPTFTGGDWTETILYNFGNGTFADGVYPTGATFDASGNLFGVAQVGGHGCPGGVRNTGTVFELTPPASGDGFWTESVAPIEGCGTAYTPSPNLLISPNGEIYGTFLNGPALYGAGAVFYYNG